MKRRLIQFVFTAVLLLAVVPALLSEEIDFNRDIRPLLSDNCFACHGPDEHDRKADLRLDTEEGAAMDLGGHAAIVPGDLSKSEAWQRIIAEDEGDLMPPPKSGKKLDAAQRELIRRWIEGGATFEMHWSYQPVKRPETKAAGSAAIDELVTAARAKKSLPAAPKADPFTLARRVHLDLHGLPPSPEAVAAFAADPSPTAYAALVDQALEAQPFGERMAVYWLDLVRYADTIGYHSDVHQSVSPYREYVIDAFNRNLPYDQFTREQLAGDLLPDPTLQQRIASGYNRLLQSTEEGGAQPKEYVAIHAADRVRNVSSVWLGSTLGCAQCHDHKYDPFTARDFYTTAAFFADVKESPLGPAKRPNLMLPTAEQTKEINRLKKEAAGFTHDQLLANDSALRDRVAAEQIAWEEASTALVDHQLWTIPKPKTVKAQHGVVLEPQGDGSLLETGPTPDRVWHQVTLPAKGTVRAIQLEALQDASFPAKGGLSRGNGNFVLTKLRIESGGKEIPIASASASFEQGGYPVASVIGKAKGDGWAVGNHEEKNRGHDRSAMFVLEAPLEFGVEGGEFTVHLHYESQHARHSIGRFRLGLTDSEAPVLQQSSGVPAELLAILEIPAAERSAEQLKKLEAHHRTLSAELKKARAPLEGITKQLARVEGAQRKMLVTEALPTPRTIRILKRGDWQDETGEIVEPAVPAFLAGGLAAKEGERLNRLDLANWIVDESNPLTARAFTNRVWGLLFGQGLSANLEDIGGQGVPPTHSELLDWLAVEFMESGWDVKHLIRTIVLSETYQMASVDPPGVRETDPANQWLSRQGRWRLEAEFVRDTALAVSGLLHHQIEGESVKPYQPAGYWAQLNFPKRKWQAGEGTDLYRRGLYTYWCRSFLHPAMLAFDAPSREECTSQRPRSNTPQQALVLLNDPAFIEAARAFAERGLNEAPDDASPEERIDFLYETALTRAPSAGETTLLVKLYEQERARFEAMPEATQAFLDVGKRPADEALLPAELAAWTSVTRALLNSYECVSRF